MSQVSQWAVRVVQVIDVFAPLPVPAPLPPMAANSHVAQAVFLPFQCQDNPNGLRTNREWPTVTCDFENEHLTMVYISLVAGAGFVVGFPLLCIRQALRYPTAVHSSPFFMLRYKFFFSNFTPHARFFGVVVLARNCLVSIISVFLTRDGFVQVACLAVGAALD